MLCLRRMKCSNCANEMITSRTGWLCVSCGHAELARPAEAAGVPQIIHERPRGRLEEPKAGEVAAAPAAVAATAPAAAPAVAPAAPAAATPVTPVVAPTLPAAPAPVAAPLGPAAEPVAAPVPAAVPISTTPQPMPEPAPTVEVAPAPTPAVAAAPAPVPAAEVPVTPAPPVAPPAEAPDTSVPAPVMEEILAAVNAQTQNGEDSTEKPEATPAPAAEPAVLSVPTEAPAETPAATVEVENAPKTEPVEVPSQPEPAVTPPPAEPEESKDSPAKMMTDLVPHTALSSSPAVLAAVQTPPAPPSKPEPRGGRKAFLGLKKKPKQSDEAPVEVKEADNKSEEKPEETKLDNIPATPPVADAPQVSSNELSIGADGQPVYGYTPAAETTAEATAAPTPAIVAAELSAKTEPETAPLPEAPISAAASKVPGKTPLQPHTHPKPMSTKQRIAVWSVLALVVLGAGGAAYYLGLGHKVVGFINSPEQASAGTPVEPSPQSVVATPSPTSSPAPSPAATPVIDVAAHNAQRQQDLNAFAEAIRKTARNGFYTVALPTSYPKLNDPQTGAPYTLTTALPSAPGEIRYWIGGSCTGAARTPGAVASRYLALQVYQAGQPAPACVQVNQP